MEYLFDFSSIWQYRAQLVDGVLGTIALAAVGTVLGVAVGIFGALARTWQLPFWSQLYAAYVELIRNTPFIIQLFFMFFGLPSLGVQIDEWQAAALAMVINLGAYSTEIIRAGMQAVPKGHLEAAQALAMSRLQIFFPRRVAPGAAQSLAGAVEPDRDRHARLVGVLANFDAGADLCGQFHPVAQFPRV
jgi:polar amino acid transport system permease protein